LSENKNRREAKAMFKKVADWCLKLSCGAIGAIVLFAVSISAGTLSSFGLYEPEMPDGIIPKDG
jgi:cyclic lactone autoinducer peptide